MFTKLRNSAFISTAGVLLAYAAAAVASGLADGSLDLDLGVWGPLVTAAGAWAANLLKVAVIDDPQR